MLREGAGRAGREPRCAQVGEEATGSRTSAHPELPKPQDKAPPVGVVDTDGIVQKSHSEFIGVGVPGEGPDSAAGPGGGTGQGETPPASPGLAKTLLRVPREIKLLFCCSMGPFSSRNSPFLGIIYRALLRG